VNRDDWAAELWVVTRWLFIAALVVFAIGTIGRLDFEDAKLMERRYCDGVEQGLWPDYNDNYEEVCHAQEH
jgi:hypothetical protein